MSFGLQVMNADGSIAVDTSKYGLYRLVHDQILTANGPFDVSPGGGFNSTLPGHVAFMVPADGSVFVGRYKIEYPTSATVRITGFDVGTNEFARLLVTAA